MLSDEAIIADMPRIARPRRRNRSILRTTDGPGGQPQRAFTAFDVRKMIESGVLAAKERLELIDGALLAMPSEGDEHLAAKLALTHFFVTQAGETANVLIDATLYLDEDVFTEPDVYLFSRERPLSELRGADTWLIVEASKTSLKRDLGEKAQLYARYGVQEYWVIDIGAQRTTVHRRPRSAGGWTEVSEHAADEIISPQALPDIHFSLQRLRWPLL